VGHNEIQTLRAALHELRGGIPEGERTRIADYLRSGRIVVAMMEYTRDVLENRFGVSGGSALHTDGTYYWRRDAAEYVQHYGIRLPTDFVDHGRRLNWSPPDLPAETIAAIDDYLTAHARNP
jgi:hypothetical protein